MQGDKSMTKATPRIAFIGLGQMGSRMAARLAEAGLPLAVHDADAGAMEPFGAERSHPSPKAAAAGCDVLLTMLPNGRVAQEAVLAADPAPGVLVVDMSSSDPADTQAMGAALADLGVALVDAPVSGGIKRAATGELAIMAGGEARDLERARPVLEHLGRRIFHCGPLGAGGAMKALNNLLSAAGFAATIEVLQIGRRFGLDPELMLDVLNNSTGRNNTTEVKITPFVLSGRFDSGFALDLMVKDLTTALALAGRTETDVPLGRLALDLWREAGGDLEAGVDHTALARWYEKRTGTQLRS